MNIKTHVTTLLSRGRGVSDPVDASDPSVSVYAWPSPAKPSALLLPRLVTDSRAHTRVKKQTSLAGAALAVMLLAVGGSAVLDNRGARADLAEAEADKAAAQAQIEQHRDAAAFFDGIAERKETLAGRVSGVLQYSEVLGAVLQAAPNTFKLAGMSFQPGQPCEGPQPFAPSEAIGCVSITGNVGQHKVAGDFVTALNSGPRSDLLAEAFLSSLAENGGEGYQMTVTVNFTDAARSTRFSTVQEPTS